MVANGEAGGGVYITPFTVEQFVTGVVELTDEQRNELLDAASKNKIIGMPFPLGSAGYVLADYRYSSDDYYWSLELGVIYNLAHYKNSIQSNTNINFRQTSLVISSSSQIHSNVDVEDGVAIVSEAIGYPDNAFYWVDGECTELTIYLEPTGSGKVVSFFTGENCSLSFGYDVYWANGKLPTIEPYTHYELSLARNANFGYNAVLTPFKVVE